MEMMIGDAGGEEGEGMSQRASLMVGALSGSTMELVAPGPPNPGVQSTERGAPGGLATCPSARLAILVGAILGLLLPLAKGPIPAGVSALGLPGGCG
jgi:hypothetical protein